MRPGPRDASPCRAPARRRGGSRADGAIAGTVIRRRGGRRHDRRRTGRRRGGRRRRRRPATRRSSRPREGARVALVSRSPLAEIRELLGPGRDRRGAGRRRLARAAPRGHARAPAAARRARARRACCATSRRRACATSSRSACASTPTATAPSRSASRAGTRGGASCTRAAARPAAGSPASCPRWPPSTSAIDGAGAHAPPARSGSHDGRCVGVLARPGRRRCRSSPAPWCSPPAAPPRSGQRTTNPRGAIGAGMTLAHAAGADAGRPRVHAVPPHRAASTPATAATAS